MEIKIINVIKEKLHLENDINATVFFIKFNNDMETIELSMSKLNRTNKIWFLKLFCLASGIVLIQRFCFLTSLISQFYYSYHVYDILDQKSAFYTPQPYES